ncbi:hypothetical protein ACJQWK_09826 [Exserohilum turcicum]
MHLFRAQTHSNVLTRHVPPVAHSSPAHHMAASDGCSRPSRLDLLFPLPSDWAVAPSATPFAPTSLALASPNPQQPPPAAPPRLPCVIFSSFLDCTTTITTTTPTPTT